MLSRQGNGRFAASPSPASLGEELAAVEREIALVERAGAPLEDRIAEAEQELAAAAAAFRQFGFARRGNTPNEQQHFWRQTTTGALATVARDALLDAEKERIRRQFEAAGGVEMSHAEKATRLNQLRQRRRRALAQHELLLRKQEAGAMSARSRTISGTKTSRTQRSIPRWRRTATTRSGSDRTGSRSRKPSQYADRRGRRGS